MFPVNVIQSRDSPALSFYNIKEILYIKILEFINLIIYNLIDFLKDGIFYKITN